jgi:hypothetical protein
MRAIKKIIALATGATMLGATLMGAMAAVPDLAEYPDFFIVGENFNGSIGIGDQAAAQDVVGAIDVVSSLSVISVTEEVAGETIAATVSEGVLVEAAGEDLNYDEDFEDILVGDLDDGDLPVLLGDGVYDENEGETSNEVDYTQELTLSNRSFLVEFSQEDDDPEATETHILIDENIVTYLYTLDFDDEVEYDKTSTAIAAEDFEGTYLTMLNNEYKISDIDFDAGYNITEIKLIGGAVTTMLAQGETATIQVGDAEYEVEAYYIGGDEKAAFRVNGVDTGTLTEDQTKKVAGVRIGVDTIFEEEAGEETPDMVKFYLGAEELVLKDGDELELNGDTIDNADVVITSDATGTNGELTEITISYTVDDDIFLAAGEEWEDPLFGERKVIFAGLEKVSETFDVTSGSDTAELKLTSNEGDELVIPFVDEGLLDNSSDMVYYGDDMFEAADGITIDQSGEGLAVGGNMLIDDADNVCGDNTTAKLDDLTNILMLVVSSGGEAKVVEIESWDYTGGDTDVKIDGNWYDYDEEIDLGFASITLTVNDDGNSNCTGSSDGWDFVATAINNWDGGESGVAHFQTELLGEVLLGAATEATNGEVNVTFFEGDQGDFLGSFELDAENDDGDIEIIMTGDGITLVEEEDGSDFEVGLDADNWGAIFRYDGEDKDDLSIEYPEEEVIAKAYITPEAASIVAGGSTAAGTRTVSRRVNIGYAKLASDLLAADPDVNSDNYLLIGGPCASEATAVVMGVSSDWPGCVEGFEEGKAMIKLIDTGAGNFAMVVAGMTALDTQRATRVLANYDDYALSGDEVEVTGTSLTDISVRVVG